MLIGERWVRQMKKYKEAKEERSVYSADSFLACPCIYLRPNRQFKYRELYYTSELPGVLPETFSVPNTHCLPTHFSPCSPSISGHICESSD